MDNMGGGEPVAIYQTNAEKIMAESLKGDDLLKKWDNILELEEPEKQEDVLGKEYRRRMKQQKG